MPKRRNKAAKIRAALAEKPDATAKEIVKTLAAQRVGGLLKSYSRTA